ncbi:membrane protein insertion efficiency factor YidD [Planctomycetota bacterium]|nr:membrane protein insertion efficiency factor YidD [Planctomycetota bacterium]
MASIYLLVTTTVYRARVVTWLIRLYQSRAPEEVRAKCVMTPRCSDYMAAAIAKYGLFAGVSKGVERLRRCGPPARNDFP